MKPHLGRLTKRSEFLRVARAGRKCATVGLILQALKRPGAEGAVIGAGAGPEGAPETAPGTAPGTISGTEREVLRYGLTASRKVGNAVTRNRARRRLRALSQEILPRRGRPGTDYVLIARRETPERPYASLAADLERALERIETGGEGRAERRPERQRGGHARRRSEP